MDLLETVRHYFVLLYWYMNERNWTVQSTSTILKPRRDPGDYGSGDIVIARFQGKPYRAVIVDINENKDLLVEASRKFDGLIQDKELSAAQLLGRMGLDAAALALQDILTNNGERSPCAVTPQPAVTVSKQLAPSSAKKPKSQKKNAVPVQSAAKMPKPQKVHTPSDINHKQALKKKQKNNENDTSETVQQRNELKEESKKKKNAILEASKVMANKIIQKMKMDKPQNENTIITSQSKVTTGHDTSSQSEISQIKETSPADIQGHFQGMNNMDIMAPVDEPVRPIIHVPAADAIQGVNNMVHVNERYNQNDVPQPASNTNDQIAYQGWVREYENACTSTSHYMASKLAPSQNSIRYPEPNYSFQQDMNNTYIYDPPMTNCPKACENMPDLERRIQKLEQSSDSNKYKYLEERLNHIEAILKASQNENGILYRPNVKRTKVQPASANRPSNTLDSSTNPQPETNDVASDISPAESAVHVNNSAEVELVPGYGITISIAQLDACLRKGGKSGTHLARLLCTVFFDEDTLARSCVKGTKTRQALDQKIVACILKYVTEKNPDCKERDIVQAMNQKCTDTRGSTKLKPLKRHLQTDTS